MTRAATLLFVLPFAAASVAAWPAAAGADTPRGPTGALGDAIMEAGRGLTAGETRGYVAVPSEAFSAPAGEVISPIIYVNRCANGCSFTKASLSDSISNQTIIGGVPAGTRMNLTPFGYSDDIWNQTIDCIKRVYAPFGVNIVTEDPGATAHHEAVLAGHAAEMSLGNGILGIAPLDSSTCRPQNNVVSFAFANDHGPSPLDMCWTVAQESAHAFGLDHEFECTDPMTYIRTSSTCQTVDKFFRNLDAPCGEFAARNCLCGGTTQNSYQRILGVHGPGTAVIAPPVVDIKMPADGATGLPRTFSVFPTAIDPRGLNHLELLINGWKWAEKPGVWQKTSIYVLDLPQAVPDGVMDIKVRGCGDTGVCGEDQVTVTRGQPCANADACLEGQKCEQGKCFWDPPTFEIGDACEYAQQCLSETCATVDGADICTEDCVSGPNDRCPDGFECISPGLGQHGKCGLVAPEATGCCSTGGASGGALAVNLGLGGMIGLLVVRRRRRR